MKKIDRKVWYTIPILLTLTYFSPLFSSVVKAETMDVSVNVKASAFVISENNESNMEPGIGGTQIVTPSVLSVSDSKPVLLDSETVADNPYGIDIKNINIKDMNGSKEIPVEITLVNQLKEDQVVDRIDLVVTKLDGTVITSQSLKTNESIASEKEKTVISIFPESLDPGNYIGTVEIFFKDAILGRGKTVFKVALPSPEVLGTSKINHDPKPFYFAIPFLLLLLAGLFVLKRDKLSQYLKKSVRSLYLYDIVGSATLLSAIGFGLFAGYSVIGIRNLDVPIINYLYPVSFSVIFTIFAVVGVILLHNRGLLEKIKLSLSLFDIAGILTFVCAIGFGLFTGYGLAGLFL